MKSRILLLSLLLAGGIATANAQEKVRYASERWQDNIFISVGGGIQTTVNSDTRFGSTVTPLINLSVGKYINPVVGIRGQLYGWKSRQKTAYPFLENGKKVKRTENYIGLNLDGMFNLTNLLCGYKPGRLFEATLFVGPSVNVVRNYGSWNVGYVSSMGLNNSNASKEEITIDPSKTSATDHKTRFLIGASVGLGAKFNVTNSFAIDLEARGQITPSILGAHSSGKIDGYAYFSAGGTYTFGGRKFVPINSEVDQSAINDELNRYRDQLALTQAELAEALNALAKIPEVVEVIEANQKSTPRAIFFKIGSAKIDDYGMVNLQLVAKMLAENPSVVYKIAGYCDEATGSVPFNQQLSDKRAQNVYDALISLGVNKDQLQYVGYGGTADMFGKNFLNRVVILE